jgi:hypothetical protein
MALGSLHFHRLSLPTKDLLSFARQIANPSANITDATASGPRTASAKLAMPTVTPNADK